MVAVSYVEVDSPHLNYSAPSQMRKCSRDALSRYPKELSNPLVCQDDGDQVTATTMVFLHVKQPGCETLTN